MVEKNEHDGTAAQQQQKQQKSSDGGEGDSPSSSSSSSSSFLTIHGVPVYFAEDWNTGIGGGLWSTGLAMARYFQTQHAAVCVRRLIVRSSSLSSSSSSSSPSSSSSQQQQQVGKLSILELGSGNGFLSVCIAALLAARKYPFELVITDTADHLPMIRKIVQANDHIFDSNDDRDGASVTAATCHRRHCVHVMEHNWGVFHLRNNDEKEEEEEEELAPGGSAEQQQRRQMIDGRIRHGHYKFDLIIGSDVAYRKELYDPLIRSLREFSDENTVSLIGVTMLDTTPSFFHKLNKAGFRYEKFADHLLEPEFRGTTFGVFAIQKRPK